MVNVVIQVLNMDLNEEMWKGLNSYCDGEDDGECVVVRVGLSEELPDEKMMSGDQRHVHSHVMDCGFVFGPNNDVY